MTKKGKLAHGILMRYLMNSKEQYVTIVVH